MPLWYGRQTLLYMADMRIPENWTALSCFQEYGPNAVLFSGIGFLSRVVENNYLFIFSC